MLISAITTLLGWAGAGLAGLGWLRPIAIVKQSSRQNNWAQDLGLTNAAFDGEFLFRYRSSTPPRWCREGEILQIPAQLQPPWPVS